MREKYGSCHRKFVTAVFWSKIALYRPHGTDILWKVPEKNRVVYYNTNMERLRGLARARLLHGADHNAVALRLRELSSQWTDRDTRRHFRAMANHEEALANRWYERSWDLISKITLGKGN